MSLDNTIEMLGVAKEFLAEYEDSFPEIRELVKEAGREIYPLIESAAFTAVDLRLKMIERVMSAKGGSYYGQNQAIAIVNSIAIDTTKSLHSMK